MRELRFGDICITDLSRSLNTPKTGIVPLIYLSSETGEDGVQTYRFCKVGKKPDGLSIRPFVVIDHNPHLRNGSAAYPTQTVLVTDTSAILSVPGSIEDADIRKEILTICETAKREEKHAIIMALCPRCRKDFLLDPYTMMKRLDPYSLVEHQCDFCQVRNGHTYVIYKRKLYGGNGK